MSLRFMEWILSLPKELAVIITAALPVFELRGAIPLGFYLKMPIAKIFILALIGNLIPVIPLYFLLRPVSNLLSRKTLFRAFFERLFSYTKKKAEIIQRYEALGLMLFVAIPLPVTGAWTGTIAAVLFKIKFKYTLLAVILGVIIAAIIVTALCIIGKISWQIIK
ncbi:MAG: small multi-drug export protein [Candidatus Omnitrophica bacterium]|nr:small multi-drug export protein [Candidatus Omnitrophota bacterium]MBU1871806.1 small multi-drug export protein [Candidatus Omnitrophota bacterium]